MIGPADYDEKVQQMTGRQNDVGAAVDEAVEVLTRLAHLTMDTSKSAGVQVGFADRLADTLTHVAANVHSVEHLTLHSGGEAGELVRRMVALSTDARDFIAWRTTPIFVSPVDPGQLSPAEPAPTEATAGALWRENHQRVLATYQQDLLMAMRHCAHELGYNAQVVLATDLSDLDPADDQLVAYLLETATAHVPHPTTI